MKHFYTPTIRDKMLLLRLITRTCLEIHQLATSDKFHLE